MRCLRKNKNIQENKNVEISRIKIDQKEKEKIKNELDELIGTKGAIIFNRNLERINKIPIGKLQILRLDEEPYIIAIDGIATPKVIEMCERLGCHNLIATNFVFVDTPVNLVSF